MRMQNKPIISQELQMNGDVKLVVREGLTAYSRDEKILYSRVWSKLEWKLRKYFAIERINRLLDPTGELSEDYIMFEMGNRMYKIVDQPNRHYNDLVVCVKPCDYTIDAEMYIDLVKEGSGLCDFFTYSKGTVVARFDKLYLNGKIVGDRHSILNERGWDIQSVTNMAAFKDTLLDIIYNYTGEKMEVNCFENDCSQVWFERSK